MILWKGHCSVHTRFTVQQIDAFRKKYPGGKVIAHPECTFDVVQAADAQRIDRGHHRDLRKARRDRSGPSATEIHLVNRLTHELAPDRTIVTLDPFGCLCSTMFRVSPNHLLWILEGLLAGTVHNQIIVPDDTKRSAGSPSTGCWKPMNDERLRAVRQVLGHASRASALHRAPCSPEPFTST